MDEARRELFPKTIYNTNSQIVKRAEIWTRNPAPRGRHLGARVTYTKTDARQLKLQARFLIG